MKKYLFLILCLFLFVGCNKKNNNQLVMVTEAGFAPYEYYENETIVGVDIDIAKEIAKEMGKELVVKDVYFNSIISELKSGKGDFAAAGMSITEDRLKQVDFSVEYAVSRQVVVVLKGSKYTVNDFKEGANLKKKKIAVQTGSVAEIYYGDELGITPVSQAKYATALEDVKAKKVDCLVMDALPAKELVAANPEVEILDGYIFEDKYGMAVKKGNTELLEVINKVLVRLMDEGKIDEFTLNHSK